MYGTDSDAAMAHRGPTAGKKTNDRWRTRPLLIYSALGDYGSNVAMRRLKSFYISQRWGRQTERPAMPA
jgi:hypothetical protein